jgi:mRNA-degrading endonuclease YafQ of YafQ-DinJ toxin-antitoxin module
MMKQISNLTSEQYKMSEYLENVTMHSHSKCKKIINCNLTTTAIYRELLRCSVTYDLILIFEMQDFTYTITIFSKT